MDPANNPLYPKLVKYMSKRLFCIDTDKEDIEEKLSRDTTKFERAFDGFHTRYCNIELGDIGGFEEGDLLRYQHDSRASFLSTAFLGFIREIRKFPDFHSKEFKDFLDNYRTFSPSIECRIEEGRVVSCAREFLNKGGSFSP